MYRHVFLQSALSSSSCTNYLYGPLTADFSDVKACEERKREVFPSTALEEIQVPE